MREIVNANPVEVLEHLEGEQVFADVGPASTEIADIYVEVDIEDDAYPGWLDIGIEDSELVTTFHPDDSRKDYSEYEVKRVNRMLESSLKEIEIEHRY